MWFIVEEQAIRFKENWENELSDWIQERLDEQDWATLDDIAERRLEQWEMVMEVIYKLSKEDGEQKTVSMYHNLKIQRRNDRKYMCEMCITKIQKAIWHQDEDEEDSSSE